MPRNAAPVSTVAVVPIDGLPVLPCEPASGSGCAGSDGDPHRFSSRRGGRRGLSCPAGPLMIDRLCESAAYP